MKKRPLKEVHLTESGPITRPTYFARSRALNAIHLIADCAACTRARGINDSKNTSTVARPSGAKDGPTRGALQIGMEGVGMLELGMSTQPDQLAEAVSFVPLASMRVSKAFFSSTLICTLSSEGVPTCFSHSFVPIRPATSSLTDAHHRHHAATSAVHIAPIGHRLGWGGMVARWKLEH